MLIRCGRRRGGGDGGAGHFTGFSDFPLRGKLKAEAKILGLSSLASGFSTRFLG